MVDFIQTQSGLVVAFVLAALVVVAAGIRLSIYGDALGDRTGLGGGIVGLIFIAAITSLPELVVSLTAAIRFSVQAAAAADNVTREMLQRSGADLACGNMLGSNAFNLLILAVLDALYRKGSLFADLREKHLRPAWYGFVLLALFSLCFFAAPLFPAEIPLLGCGWLMPLIPAAYMLMLRCSPPVAQEKDEVLPDEDRIAHMPAIRFYSVFTALSLMIVLGGVALSVLGGRMALPPEQGGFGLEASVIGSLFLAVSTSLPELVVGVASIRLGFLDMAAGNVLGSNLFNLLIVFCADIGLRNVSLLSCASPRHWMTVGLIALLTLLTLAGLRFAPRARFAGMSPVSWLILLVYAAGAVFIFAG